MAKYAWLMVTALLCTVPVFAANPKPATPPPPKADPALLEFLGSWQGADGKWVDPMTFASIDPDKLAAENARREGKPLPPKETPPGKTPPGDGTSRT
ncbi:MAG: hypothetical protein WBR15_08430 [Gammaproteobacteria bacterium]